MSLDMERLLDAIRKVESNGNANAISPKGAKGPYQFMDATAAQYGVQDPFDEEQSRAGARRYMEDLLNQFGGDLDSAIVAYNGGPGRLKRRGSIDAMPQESREYLVKVKEQYQSGVLAADARTAQFQSSSAQPVAAIERLFPGSQVTSRRALFPLNRENDALRASVLQPKPVNQAQRVYDMQLRTGLPAALIERNLDYIETQAKANDFDPERFRKESPLLAQWLAENPVRASLAQDDYETLSALEKVWATAKAVPTGIEQGVKKERLMKLSSKAVTGEITPQEELERNRLKTELQALAEEASVGAPSWAKAAADVVGMQVPMGVEAARMGVYGMGAGAAMGGAAGLIGGPGAPVTVTAGAAAGGLIGFKTTSAASYIEQTYRMSVGEAFDDLEGATAEDGTPIDPVVARYASLLVAVPNALLEFASLRTAVKLIPGADKVVGRLSAEGMKKILVRPTVMAALKDFGKKYAVAVGTETFTEGMQKLNVIIAREAATGDLGEGLSAEDASAIASESTEAFKASVVLGALGSGPKVVELYADMDKAAKNEQFMRSLGEAAANSSTLANSPKAFGEYVSKLKENGSVQNVYIPVEQWDALFQNQAPDAAAEVFGNLEQYSQAKITGGDLVIPIETYAEKLAGTEFHEQLIPHSKFNAEEMTPTEAVQAAELEPQLVETLRQEMEETLSKEAPLQAIYEDVYSKLKNVGLSNAEANRDAMLWRERLNARAERLGIDPLELYNEKPLLVQRELPSGQVLFQGERGASVPSKNLIAMFKGADPSTFVHETGHLWLEELRQDALRPDAPEQLRRDWEMIKEWSGATDEMIPTNAHEAFARGFEAYMMEGNSPSFQLREVFNQFMNWLTRIYQSMTMLDVQLTQDVREVMDRLIATDEAIKQNRERNAYHIPLFEQGDMTAEEYGAYTQLMDEAKATAEDTFRAKVLKELRREKLQSWRDEKKALAPVVRAELLSEPVYRAAYWLWSGKLPDGSVIPDMAATKLDKQTLLDMGVTLSDLPFRYQENGLHPDVVAQLFGLPSGESLVRDLIGLPTLKDAINDEVNRRIREKHGGIIVEGATMEEAAMEVQNTRQIDVFNMELRLLKRMGARREATHPAILKDIAHKMIARKRLKELNPRVFEEAAFKAGEDARNALLGREFRMGTGRNLDIAFDAVTRQMLNIYLYREAAAAKKMAERSVKKWKKFLFRSDQRLAKTYNMDMVGAARAIASVHGIGGAADTAAAHMARLQEYDPQSFEDLRGIVDLASGDGRKIEDLTVDDFMIVKDAIEGLWATARRSRQIEIDGVKLERDNVVNELSSRIGELVKPGRKRAGYERAATTWDKTKMGFLGAAAMLRRVEHWVDAMDNGEPNGVFRRYVWQPISEAADQYREHRRVMLEKYVEHVKSFPKESAKSGKIEATEIGYTFSSKAELLGAMLHTGNQSNKQKLLVGRMWGAFDPNGDLDSQRWDAFVQRMQDTGVLTAADYKFIQGVWDLFEEIKPQAQKAHKEMYGHYFEEITAQPIDTPFGVFRGGYYPASTDPLMVEDANIRAEKEAMEGRPSSFMFPTTGRGFTKKRSAMYNKPLTLDLGLIPQQMEKVLRFIHIEPRVKDVGRVVVDAKFRANLAVLDSEAATVMLMPWLQRSALQLVEQPSGPRLATFDKFFHAVRTNTGLQFMAANVSVALQQLTGLGLSAVKVKPRYLAGALWRYATSPSTYHAGIVESSSFMRNRTSTQLMDVRRSIDNILLNPSKYQKAKNFAHEHGYFMQVAMQNVVDTITWGAAYEQATRNNASEKEAVRFADSVVRETQGTFAPEDISRFEAGPAHLRIFTMFYSFFNMAANLNATEFIKAQRRGGFSGGGRALYVYTMGFMIPAVLAEAIVQMMSGEAFDDDDEDGYLDNVLSIFFGGQARMGTAMVPLVGQVVQLGINQFNDKWYDDRISTSPAVSAMESVARVPYDVYRLAAEEDARIKRPLQDVLTTIGLATGLPLAPVAKPIGYLTDVEQGYLEESDNPVEIARGLISGRAPE